ncbi:hypothetical protein AJ79_08458 [Helicocarpus griseus UAMH5409]|uniref:Uncharacterized protein n=1 Tax=Helicocarpus griseus UAMH5409 TaxID=1447875 RepID=A0A2B7WSQ0_9EURO|nr:hypothetical protein AJ79_08458 [Helicocarpus griseus UAMH5409]
MRIEIEQIRDSEKPLLTKERIQDVADQIKAHKANYPELFEQFDGCNVDPEAFGDSYSTKIYAEGINGKTCKFDYKPGYVIRVLSFDEMVSLSSPFNIRVQHSLYAQTIGMLGKMRERVQELLRLKEQGSLPPDLEVHFQGEEGRHPSSDDEVTEVFNACRSRWEKELSYDKLKSVVESRGIAKEVNRIIAFACGS